MTEGYMALFVSIVKDVTPEAAFRLLEKGKGTDRKRKRYKKSGDYRKWGKTEIALMKIMRKSGMSWEEVGKKYGIDGKHARALVARRKEGENEKLNS